MVDLEKHITDFAEQYLENSAYFIVDVVGGSSNKKKKIAVFIDADTSVNIEKCAELSRHITGRVEEELGYEDPYVIEVSSAGIDRPLVLKRQYVKNKGREVEVVMTDGEKRKGVLTEVKDDDIELTVASKKKKEEEKFIIDFNQIKSTKVVISF